MVIPIFFVWLLKTPVDELIYHLTKCDYILIDSGTETQEQVVKWVCK